GIPINITIDSSTTAQCAGSSSAPTKARSTEKGIEPQNNLTCLRIRSEKHETMVAPDKECLLIVIQNACE
ncbi:DLRB2 protein, partial [Cephalopterus ornatus]|nr:DLRB2 protein [Cephalopterus ornatus]